MSQRRLPKGHSRTLASQFSPPTVEPTAKPSEALHGLASPAQCRDIKGPGGHRRHHSSDAEPSDGIMFESFKSFISEFVEGEKHPSQFADNDYRLAAAALLVHAAAIDGEMSQPERDKLHSVIKQRFALTDKAADELIAKATEAEQESVDL